MEGYETLLLCFRLTAGLLDVVTVGFSQIWILWGCCKNSTAAQLAHIQQRRWHGVGVEQGKDLEKSADFRGGYHGATILQCVSSVFFSKHIFLWLWLSSFHRCTSSSSGRLYFPSVSNLFLFFFFLSFCLSVFSFSSPLFLSFFSLSVSPELLGVLSSIAAFMALMALFFLYLSNKLSVGSPDDLSHFTGYENTQPGTRHTLTASTHTLRPGLWF